MNEVRIEELRRELGKLKVGKVPCIDAVYKDMLHYGETVMEWI